LDDGGRMVKEKGYSSKRDSAAFQKGRAGFTNDRVTASGATLANGFPPQMAEDTIGYSAYFAPPVRHCQLQKTPSERHCYL